ncbi:MAG: hypothetical protein QOD06_3237 [Candidatus Binatota bacterium]|nr:hypothetical protein [Candidatus Binatota bacterium]
MEGAPIDARRLVEEVWREAEAERVPPRPFVPTSLPPADHIQHRPELAQMNRAWLFDLDGGPAPSGALAPVKRALRALARRVVLPVMSSYLVREREFLENLVRFENDLARRADELAEETRTVARSVRELGDLVRVELERLRDRQDRLHRLLEARVEDLEHRRAID